MRAELFGYALAYGEEPTKVIEKEINSCLAQAGSDVKLNKAKEPNIAVKYFEPNSTNLIAVVECLVLIENGVGDVLVELVVTGTGNENHISLEQISYAA